MESDLRAEIPNQDLERQQDHEVGEAAEQGERRQA
jgi:hypothetical protein